MGCSTTQQQLARPQINIVDGAAQFVVLNFCWGWVQLVQKTPMMRGKQSAAALRIVAGALCAGGFVAAFASFTPLGFFFTDDPAAQVLLCAVAQPGMNANTPSQVALFVTHSGGIAASLLSTWSVLLLYGHRIVRMLRDAVDGEQLRRQSSQKQLPNGECGRRGGLAARSLSLRSLRLPAADSVTTCTLGYGTPPRPGEGAVQPPRPSGARYWASGVAAPGDGQRHVDSTPPPDIPFLAHRTLQRSTAVPSPLGFFGSAPSQPGGSPSEFVVTLDLLPASPASSFSSSALVSTPLGSTPRRTKLRRTLTRFKAFRALVLASLAVHFAAYAAMIVWAPLRSQFTCVLAAATACYLVVRDGNRRIEVCVHSISRA